MVAIAEKNRSVPGHGKHFRLLRGTTVEYSRAPDAALNADWSTPPAGTNPIVNNLYQGMTLDPVTGLYYERHRNYSPSLGTWTSQDPAGYINGADTYQFVLSNPVNRVDPWGLWHWYNPWTWNWSWLPWVPKVAVDTAKEVTPGGEFCGAVEASAPLAKAGIFANTRHYYDQTHNINSATDPLYQGLNAIASGTPWQDLPPAEQQAVQNWSQNAAKSFW